MREGYLIVETPADRGGLIRVWIAEQRPPAPCTPDDRTPHAPRMCCAAQFSDVDTARMHAHRHLHRNTVDAEAGLYRVDPAAGVAAVDAIDLRHRIVYLDPKLVDDPRRTLLTRRHQLRRRRIDRIFTGVGIAAVVLLFVLNFIVGL